MGEGKAVDDKNQLVSSGPKQHYITRNEMVFAKMFSTMKSLCSMCHLSLNNKVYILSYTSTII